MMRDLVGAVDVRDAEATWVAEMRDAEGHRIGRVFPALGVGVGPLDAHRADRAVGTPRIASLTAAGFCRVGEITLKEMEAPPDESSAALTSGREATVAHEWHLVQMGVGLQYPYSGSGVRVAIVDTGIDDSHPDLVGTRVGAQYNFVDSSCPDDVTDRSGHGTICAALVAGARTAGYGRRYAVAPEAELLVAKAMNDQGHGRDETVVEAIAWAHWKGARVINLSMGIKRMLHAPFTTIYEDIARSLLEEGALLIAAAGHGSNRPARIVPVENPAACPSVMAVGALTRQQDPAATSPGSMDSVGTVDLSAPGEDVPCARRRADNGRLWALAAGTSVAAALVSGAAALMIQHTPGLRGRSLWDALVRACRKEDKFVARDHGAGLVRAP